MSTISWQPASCGCGVEATIGPLRLAAWRRGDATGTGEDWFCWLVESLPDDPAEEGADLAGVGDDDRLPTLDAAKSAAITAAVGLLCEAIAACGSPSSQAGEFTAHPGMGIVDGEGGEMGDGYALDRGRALICAAVAASKESSDV